MNLKKSFKKVILMGLFMSSTVGISHATEVELHTSFGLIVVKVDEVNAPVTAKNFLQYVSDGFFDGLLFHRVIPGFVIQGGGFDSEFNQRKTRAPIRNEARADLKNLAYSLSMARTQDPHSATSQFFINLNDNANLDYSANNPGYAVFAKVVTGRKVVDTIAAAKTIAYKQHRDVPAQRIYIEKAIIR